MTGRRRLSVVLFCLLTVVLFAGPQCSSAKKTTTDPAGVTATPKTTSTSTADPPLALPAIGDPRRDLFDYINWERSKVLNRSQLTWDANIAGAAQAWVDLEVANQFINTVNPKNKKDTIGQRLVNDGYPSGQPYGWVLVWNDSTYKEADADLPYSYPVYSTSYTKIGIGYNNAVILTTGSHNMTPPNTSHKGNWVLLVGK